MKLGQACYYRCNRCLIIAEGFDNELPSGWECEANRQSTSDQGITIFDPNRHLCFKCVDGESNEGPQFTGPRKKLDFARNSRTTSSAGEAAAAGGQAPNQDVGGGPMNKYDKYEFQHTYEGGEAQCKHCRGWTRGANLVTECPARLRAEVDRLRAEVDRLRAEK